MSAARHVKAITAGIAECVTEDHLPIRWNYGTRPAKYWHWRAIRRRNPFPSLSRTTATYCDFNCDFDSSSLEPRSTTGSTDSDVA